MPNAEPFFFIVPAVLILAIVFRVMAGCLDQIRIRSYISGRGGSLLSSHWSPFGPGWFGDKYNRIYSVHFVDVEGNEHKASCKTSMLTGVYFTEDRVVKRSDFARSKLDVLEAENQRLKQELARLRGGNT